MRKRKFIWNAVIVAAVSIMAACAYWGWVLYSARQYTINVVLPAEKEAQYPLQLSSLTPRQLDILLKVEDPHFFDHHGVDFSTPGAGITTIAQGLVKHLYFVKFRPGVAKFKQTLIAYFVLDPLMSKRMQLTRFINTVYLGPKATGFEQAAGLYFNKRFEQLAEDQYIALVAMIIAPAAFSVDRYPERNRARTERIKQVVSGQYKPKGLFDLFYGKLDQETQKNLPPVSYFESYYK
ncbi:MAG: transglycosylase domain-containing protein [Pseudomonadota bacterium]